MDGPSLISFTAKAVPKLVDRILEAAQLEPSQIDWYILHQATYKMLDQLRRRLELDEQRVPILLEQCGNTVSSTIPIVIDHFTGSSSIRPGTLSMLVGFGVGWCGSAVSGERHGKAHWVPRRAKRFSDSPLRARPDKARIMHELNAPPQSHREHREKPKGERCTVSKSVRSKSCHNS